MAYRILSFDGLLLPEYIQESDFQDMGTGEALTAYLQLPGGGWYDQYRDLPSPQGIRPIVKNCMLWGETAAELKENLDDLRGKIGWPGRLVVAYDDGSLRWQWARLKRVVAPRPEKAKSKWLPMRLEWETVAQCWYGIIAVPDEWTWGDGSWLWGDGTAEFGQNEHSYTIVASPDTIEMEHAGNIPARNIRIEISKDGTQSSYILWNRATGQYLTISPTATNGTIYIDAGSREVYEVDHDTAVTIATIEGKGNKIYVVSSGAHGLDSGDDVRISGTEHYDGLYRDITVSDSTDFTLDVDPRHLASGETETAGTIEVFADSYADLTAEDKTFWFSLAPGTNEIDIQYVNTGTIEIVFRFYDHYA